MKIVDAKFCQNLMSVSGVELRRTLEESFKKTIPTLDHRELEDLVIPLVTCIGRCLMFHDTDRLMAIGRACSSVLSTFGFESPLVAAHQSDREKYWMMVGQLIMLSRLSYCHKFTKPKEVTDRLLKDADAKNVILAASESIPSAEIKEETLKFLIDNGYVAYNSFPGGNKIVQERKIFLTHLGRVSQGYFRYMEACKENKTSEA